VKVLAASIDNGAGNDPAKGGVSVALTRVGKRGLLLVRATKPTTIVHRLKTSSIVSSMQGACEVCECFQDGQKRNVNPHEIMRMCITRISNRERQLVGRPHS